MAVLEDLMTETVTVVGRPGPSVQEVLAGDKNPAPEIMRSESPATGLGTEDISIERYFDKSWHDREIEKIWRKTWQIACRVEELPDVGDHIVYEIAHESLIVVRSAPDEIRAYVNSCLHRGTLLRKDGGCVKQFRCPFHGFTWSLQGKLTDLPADWDFPQVDRNKFNLPEAKVGLWGGFVFINLDPDCESLEKYIEILPQHFEAFALEDRYKAVHVAKIMPCNWKLSMEAFIEAYHVPLAHAQTLSYYGDQNTQYDVWPGVHHVNRMISVQGISSPALDDITPEMIVKTMRRDIPFFDGKPIEIGPGDTARSKLAERAREKMSLASGRDLSGLSDTESLDLIQYSLFPNSVPWGGQSLPVCYRFRPYGDNPEMSIMEIMFLFAKAPDGSHPAPAKIHWLGVDQPWADAPELGSAARISDQDTDNLKRIQRGLRATKKPGVTLAVYQESRIRHFHQTLDAYMAR
jgi:phenylpropionate dioxygenase-like ring-hydroxylating dioxygenase large terminal subunit